ncbi:MULTISPECIES: hypothetical protein [Paenibacillus]|nr:MULTISPECIES: hypothetical protein [Paenibacillus]MCM3338592.1 adenylate kinase and related kinase [Paenibacillus sp. MER TA 81-3]
MNRQLIMETGRLLTQEMPPEAGIRLTVGSDEHFLLDMASALHAYDMEPDERRALLGCYWLLRQAMRTHQHVPAEEQLAGKTVLDGDFLMSMYYQFAVRHGQMKLVIDLATTNKRIQIRRAEGNTTDMLLHQRICRFLAKHYKQVAYEVI